MMLNIRIFEGKGSKKSQMDFFSGRTPLSMLWISPIPAEEGIEYLKNHIKKSKLLLHCFVRRPWKSCLIHFHIFSFPNLYIYFPIFCFFLEYQSKIAQMSMHLFSSIFSLFLVADIVLSTTEWFGDLRAYMNPPKSPPFYDVVYDESGSERFQIKMNFFF